MLDVCIDDLSEVEKGRCVVVSILGGEGCLAVGSDQEEVDNKDAALKNEEAMVEKQKVGYDDLVVGEMPIETLLPSVGKTRSDGTFQRLLGSDGRMLGFVLLGGQIVVHLVGRAP